MTRDEVIRMAREAGFVPHFTRPQDAIVRNGYAISGELKGYKAGMLDIERFAALAAEPTKPKQEPVAVFDEQMGHPVLLLGSPMLKDKQPLYTAPPDAEALRRDAERWRFYEAAGSNLTLRLHNTRSDHRNAVIDAAMQEDKR